MHPSFGTVALLPLMCPGMFSNMLHWLTVERNPQAPPCHLESSKKKNERLITLITNKNQRLESSFMPTPYRKQKTSIQRCIPYRRYLSTDSNATFLWTMHLGRIVALPSTASQRNLLMRLAYWCAWELFFENEGRMSISFFFTKYCPRPKIAPPHKNFQKFFKSWMPKLFLINETTTEESNHFWLDFIFPGG